MFQSFARLITKAWTSNCLKERKKVLMQYMHETNISTAIEGKQAHICLRHESGYTFTEPSISFSASPSALSGELD